jgi:hypothetical protein
LYKIIDSPFTIDDFVLQVAMIFPTCNQNQKI